MSDSKPPIDRARLRATRGVAGKGLLVAFGIGLGIAVSVAVTGEPSEFRTVAVEDGADFAVGPVDDAATEGAGGPRTVTRTEGGQAASGVAGTGGGAAADGGASGPAAVSNPESFECVAGKNGGATDTGVTGNKISVAANVVLDGNGASFLKEAIIGIQAVIDEANVEGICGRRIDLKTRNDSWDAPTGLSYIENYIAEGRFALVVNPSSEGLDSAVKNGKIEEAAIPVVGTDGMLKSQYEYLKGGKDLASWLWPVAASTRTTMHIIAEDACKRGAKSFALVYDTRYKFGPEGKDAFEKQFERMKSDGGCGSGSLESIYTLPIDADQPDTYPNKANTFNQQCADSSGNPTCDVVAFLMDSSTAVRWIQAGGVFGENYTMGPQPLFNDSFAERCVQERNARGEKCDLIVWTGYNPPIGARENLPDVAKYVNDLRARDSSADPNNAFTEGAYLGAQVFVEALKQVGPNLTRENLKNVLNNMTYTSDLSNDLTWTGGAQGHYANQFMQAFKITSTQQQGFTGWADDKDWQRDPRVGED